MIESRELNIIFTKSGAGSTTTKLTLPISWINKLNITKEEREVIVTLEEDRIVIKKK